MRASGYHLSTWSLMAALLSLPAVALATGKAWPRLLAAAYASALLALATALSLVHERRVAKMLPEAPASDWPRVVRLWLLVLAVGLAWTVPVLLAGCGRLLQPVWLLCLGVAVAFVGRGRVPAYSWLGAVFAACGVAALVAADPAPPAAPWPVALYLGNAAALAFGVPAGLWVNNRYLWASRRASRRT